MTFERGTYASIPYAATGSGPPLMLLAGLYPVTGVARDGLVRAVLSGMDTVLPSRRLVVTNRRPGLPAGMSIADLAAEQADAVRALDAGPVDVLGMSTGGSIAQQLAADHPDTVRRLVLVSTACRLGPPTREAQLRVARAVRDGNRTEAAVALTAVGLPRWGNRFPVRTLAAAAASRILPDEVDAADLATTAEAEDGFDLRRCAAIGAPTLLVVGARDRLYPAELFQETARLIPDCRLRVVARRGHGSVFLRSPAASWIAGFLTTQ